MQEQTVIDHTGPNPMYSEGWEIDQLCNRFGLSRTTARNIVDSYSGDRQRMEQEAERLMIYERLQSRRQRG